MRGTPSCQIGNASLAGIRAAPPNFRVIFHMRMRIQQLEGTSPIGITTSKAGYHPSTEVTTIMMIKKVRA